MLEARNVLWNDVDSEYFAEYFGLEKRHSYHIAKLVKIYFLVLGNYPQHHKLINAVINQFGGWIVFEGYVPYVCNHGIDGGFVGFIYYVDTMKFYNKNKKLIIQLAMEQYKEMDYKSMLEMFCNFNCFRNYTEQEILEGMYEHGEYETQIKNGLAWYAAEEVCRMFYED